MIVCERPLTEATSKSMRGNHSKNTKPELLLRKALWKNGLRGYRTNYSKLPGKPDVAFVGKKVCVFVHGCFWHGCPKCGQRRNLRPTHNRLYWDDKIERNKARDEAIKSELAGRDWKVFEFWECDVLKNVEALLPALFEACQMGAGGSL